MSERTTVLGIKIIMKAGIHRGVEMFRVANKWGMEYFIADSFRDGNGFPIHGLSSNTVLGLKNKITREVGNIKLARKM